jgi:hypothetical protein
MAEQEVPNNLFDLDEKLKAVLMEEREALSRQLGAAACEVVAANERYHRIICNIIEKNDQLREAGVDAAVVASYIASQIVQPPTSLYVV